MSIPVALTCGDPAGVGPEVVEAALRLEPKLAPQTVVLGPAAWARRVAAATGAQAVPTGDLDDLPTPGRPSTAGAKGALAALEEVAAGTRAGRYRAAVTGPISKAWMHRIGWPHPGHTEFFAAQWGGPPTMGFVGEELRVVLATWHIPLAEVPAAVTEEVLARAVERAGGLARSLGAEEPRIAVCGLNPHAGEDGLLGTEERDHLNPWLDKLRPRWPRLGRCEPADTVFWRARRGEFDVVVALYHDQGLAPLKTLEFDSAVNVTLGLPWVRTSPDHGTAYALAGSGRADAGSMRRALRLAFELSRPAASGA